ncbi:MAG: hypothetical protein LBB41_01590, partial [Prevotellaceae bacterium]|nr:hypothetical protein [Prevotellaceae bacterium]
MKTEQKNISEKEFLLLCNQSKEEIEIPQMLENKLDTLIDKLAAAEKQKIVALPDFWAWVGSIAAAVALILSIGFYLKDDNNSTQFADNKQISIDNLNQADREKVLQAERTLTLVSQNFNKGI